MLPKTKSYLVITLLLCWAFSAHAGETTRIEGRHGPLADSVSYAFWIDSADCFIQQAIAADKAGRFAIYKGGSPFYLGFMSKTCWVRVRVENTDPAPVTLYWNIYRDIDTLSLFEVSDSGQVLKQHPFLSVTVPIPMRPLKVRSLSFEINLNPHEARVLYLRVVNKGDILRMPMNITTSAEYYQRELPFYLTYGIFFGIFFFAVFANLLLWFFLRDSLHLWYAGYVLMVMLFLCMDVYLESHLLPYFLFETVNAAGRLVIIFLMFTLQAGMAQRMIGLTPQNSRFYYVTTTLVKILLGCALVSLVINLFRYHLPMPVQKVLFGGAILTSGFAMTMFFITIGEQIIKRNALAVYYALSCFLLLICAANYFLGSLNSSVHLLFNNNNGLALGLTLEILALAALVGYRFYLVTREKMILLSENEQKQEQLTMAVVQAHEDEQESIARNLHDGPVSHLMALHMFVNQKLHVFRDIKGAGETAETLLEIQTRLDKSIRDVREVSHNLMPKEFEVNKLTEIILEHVQSLENNTNVNFVLMADEKINTLPKNIQLHLYRMVSELISNILRHSQASEAIIQILTIDHKIQLMVEDDGIGVRAEAGTYGIGLKNIRTRVALLKGKLTIDSGKMGTVIIIEIPGYERG